MRDPQILESVKATLALLVAANPGRAIEVRIPPYAAVPVSYTHLTLPTIYSV